MSRKRANPSTSRAAQRRAEAARRAAPRPAPRRASSGRGLARTIAVLAVVAILVAIILGLIAYLGRGGDSVPVGSASPTLGSSPAATGAVGSAPVGGGPLAEKLVAALHADPFRTHVEETTVARSTAGNVTVTITARAVGDVSGRDVALHVTSTGAGPAVDQEVVSLGGTTWIRRTGATVWEVHRRTEAGASIDGLLTTLRLVDDPAELADVGMDTVDGRALHHLTAVGSVAYRSPDGADGAYDRLDIWTTDAGIPVLVKGSFSASQGVNALVGNVTIRYADVGQPVTITKPGGAPTPIP